jgi:hypothetical protein
MAKEDRLGIVDDLLVLPFPAEDTWEGDRSSGPGYHVRVLQASRDFWDDTSEEIVLAAQEEIDTALQAMLVALTARWGGPEPVDLEHYLWGESAVPEPVNQLCQISAEMLVWRRPDAGRWVALAVGQGDREFPIELLAAIGEAPIP